MKEFASEVREGQETEKSVEQVDSDFENELDGTYNAYLEGKSKEELIKMREELLKMKEGDDTEDDTDPEKVLKRTLHR